MELLVITRPGLEDETALCNELFAKGLGRLHLRKPEARREQLVDWIERIEPSYRRRIVVHDHFDLALQYGLGGIHLGRRNPNVPEWFDRKHFSLSRSCHSIAEVKNCQADYDYVFLSPIFDSISKQGYRAAFSREELVEARDLLSRNVYALGGITFERLPKVEHLGFAGAAMLGGFWDEEERFGEGAVSDIIFDLGGVLLDLDMEGVGKACMRLGINPDFFFVKTDADNTSTVCHGISAGKAITAYQVGMMTSEEFLSLVLEHSGEGITREDVVEAWNACIGPLPRYRLDMIRALRRKGYRTHLLSNTNDLHWEEIKRRFFHEEGYTCSDLFDHVFVSHEVRLAKPAPEIYRHAVRQIGSPAEQCFFIDDAEINVEAAKREGMQGAWLDVKREGHLRDILARFL
ncbi:MAG: HAD-IA family hydrolase [Bacteroidaceae bacterium]|nr:HAD-IA family hydrolase [Bacteroidaceae bacterium]